MDSRSWRRVAVPVATLALLIVFDLLLFIPGAQFAGGALWPLRLSFELAVIVALAVLSAKSWLLWPVRVLGALAYVWLLLFLTYHQAYAFFFRRAPALREDWRLLLNLKHFLNTMGGLKWGSVTVAAILGLVALAVFVGAVLAGVQRWAARRPRLLPSLLALAVVGVLALLLARSGLANDAALVQLPSRLMVDNYRTSAAAAAREAELLHAPRDPRNDVFSTVKLQRRPNFYLILIEAYGEILATWDMAPAYEVLMRRVEDRLTAHGYHAASAYSAAPVHGGTSWFSISTVLTGILVDRPLAYSVLGSTGRTVPSLPRFFHEQGYRTYTLQAGTKDNTGLQLDLFGHDELVRAATIGYHGKKKYGYGEVPDQYALGYFREKIWAHAPSPRYLYFMSVSTHFPWDETVPPYFRDWHDTDGPTADVDPSWPLIAEKATIGTAHRRSYFQSIEYEWRLLTELLDEDPSKDVVVLVAGDHQPRLEANAPETTMSSPIHVISRDPALVKRFLDAGFQPGMLADPHQRPPFKHEGLFSLMVSQLAALYGNQAVPYFPDGIGLSGLNP